MQAHSDALLRFFPLPTFLRMDAGGLEISEHSVKYLSFVGKEGALRIGTHLSVDVPSGVIVGGEIQDIQALAKVLLELRKKVGEEHVHVSLPEQKGYIFRMMVPKAQDLSFAEAVQFRLEEYVPLPPHDVVFDAEPIERESTETDHCLNVTAFPRGTVEGYYQALEIAGYLPLSFEIESQAAARAVTPQGDTETRMIVDFGETRTAIAVADRGVVRFTTSLDLAGSALTAALTKLGVAAGDMQHAKNDIGLIGEGAASYREALIPIVGRLRDELSRHFVYWHTHTESAGMVHTPITSVVLCGGNANLRGLPEHLGQGLRVPVSLADVWQNAFSLSEHIPDIARNESLRFATVAGLALRGGLQSV